MTDEAPVFAEMKKLTDAIMPQIDGTMLSVFIDPLSLLSKRLSQSSLLSRKDFMGRIPGAPTSEQIRDMCMYFGDTGEFHCASTKSVGPFIHKHSAKSSISERAWQKAVSLVGKDVARSLRTTVVESKVGELYARRMKKPHESSSMLRNWALTCDVSTVTPKQVIDRVLSWWCALHITQKKIKPEAIQAADVLVRIIGYCWPTYCTESGIWILITQ